MSGIEAALRQRLLDAPPVTAIAGTRVTWLTRPQGGALPALVLTMISHLPEEAFDGDTGFTNTLVQIDALAAQHREAVMLSRAALAALRSPAAALGIQFQRAFVTGTRDTGEDTADAGFIARRSADLRFYSTTL